MEGWRSWNYFDTHGTRFLRSGNFHSVAMFHQAFSGIPGAPVKVHQPLTETYATIVLVVQLSSNSRLSHGPALPNVKVRHQAIVVCNEI